MSNVQTTLYKNMRGAWVVESKVQLSNTHFLTISTLKRSNGCVETSASVGVREGNFLSHRMYQDFSSLIHSQHYSRVTKQVLEKQHQLIDKESVVAQAMAFYKFESELA